MFFIALFFSILNCILNKKYYLLISIGLLLYLANILLKGWFDIDYSLYFIKFRYLLYMIFFYNFALEEKS